MGEVLQPAPYPYPFFAPEGEAYPLGPDAAPPAAMPMLPPGALMPHPLPYAGGGLAPFPHGMPLPLPPEAAAELAAVAGEATAELAQPVVQQPAAQQPVVQQPAAKQQPQQATSTVPRTSFLARLQQACGTLLVLQPPPTDSRSRSAHQQTQPAFDAAAAAGEFEQRWQAAAVQAAPSSRPAVAQPQQEPQVQLQVQVAAKQSIGAAAATHPGVPRAKPARPPSRGGSTDSLGSANKAKVPGSGSGRSSPAVGAGSKPVVVAVRAWSSEDSTSDGTRWRIQSAKPQATAAGGQ